MRRKIISDSHRMGMGDVAKQTEEPQVREWMLCVQVKNAFAEQKLKEQQQQVEDEARRERDRLDDLRKREQDRILEVRVLSLYLLSVGVIHKHRPM